MDCHVTFGHRGREEMIEIDKGVFKLMGTILPLQFISVQWWKKQDSQKWQQEIDTITSKKRRGSENVKIQTSETIN